MNNQDAKNILVEAIYYKADKLGDNNAKKNILNALNWMAQIHGWNNDNAWGNFIEHATTQFDAWRNNPSTIKPSGIICVDASDKAELVARYCHWVAASEIKANQTK